MNELKIQSSLFDEVELIPMNVSELMGKKILYIGRSSDEIVLMTENEIFLWALYERPADMIETPEDVKGYLHHLGDQVIIKAEVVHKQEGEYYFSDYTLTSVLGEVVIKWISKSPTMYLVRK